MVSLHAKTDTEDPSCKTRSSIQSTLPATSDCSSGLAMAFAATGTSAAFTGGSSFEPALDARSN